MDPRHPEKVISYIEEVKAKYDSVNERIDKATSSKEINALEREGVACVNELFIVVPRLQEALITHSAEARRNLRRKVSMEPIVEPAEPEEPAEEEPTEPVEPVEPKPVEKPKKKTARKKSTKKADK